MSPRLPLKLRLAVKKKALAKKARKNEEAAQKLADMERREKEIQSMSVRASQPHGESALANSVMFVKTI